MSTTPPPVPSKDSPSWTDPVWASPMEASRKIFCNRSLNMKSIKAVGFDMDYTLAQYKEETFETLAYDETIKKLVDHYNYPKCLKNFKFNSRYVVRGLVIDKKRGNLIKADRHKYVKIAFHGFRQLTADERKSIYGKGDMSDTFVGVNFANIDTLFSLAETYLFCQLVELKDANPGLYLADKEYFDLYTDVRRAVDWCHRDGSLKVAIAKNPAKFIHADPSLAPMLTMLRTSGRSTFIVTNSMWDYTNVVMNFLIGNKTGKDIDHQWLKYFDVVIVGSAKPKFYSDDANNLFHVDLSTGLLQNTDNGSPMVQLDAALKEDPAAPLMPDIDSTEGPAMARVFQGGGYRILHSMLRIKSGSEVLYAGDHIYGDILRAKKSIGWRTLLLVPELEKEMAIMRQPHMQSELARFVQLRHQWQSLDDQFQRLSWHLKHTSGMDPDQRSALGVELGRLSLERDQCHRQHRAILQAHHEAFHPVWGQLMLCGNQSSHFAHQIQRFACLYTSHIGNLRGYSPEKSYRTGSDAMPHF